MKNLRLKTKKYKKGFTLLLSIIITGILLLVSFIISNVALKELVLVYSGSESQQAFYAADSGVECAAYWDAKNPNGISSFASPSGSITCNGQTVSSGSQTVNTSPTQPSAIGGVIGSGNSASFLSTDTVVKGSWHGVYGSNGYNVAGGTQSYPAYATVSITGSSPVYTWDPSGTLDPRALYKDSVTLTRISSTWYSATSFDINVNITDGSNRKVALYMSDYDGTDDRTQRIDVLDADTLSVLSSQNVSSFTGGKYLVWNISGHVIFRVNNTSSINAVISGIFFDAGVGAAAVNSIFQVNFTKGCAIVRVTKQSGGLTTIDSRGYNDCGSALRKFERGIIITY